MAALDFAPFAKLKSLLVLEKAAITDYPQLGEIVNRVKVAFEIYLGAKLDLATYVHSQFQQTATRYIYLPALPIVSVASVVLDSLAQTDYKITAFGVVLPAAIQETSVTVTFSGGYDSTSYPPAIEKAALTQTVYEFKNVNNMGSTSVSTEGGSVTYPELGLLTEVKRMLAPFRNASVMVPL